MPGSICDVLPAAAALLGVRGGVQAWDALGLTETLGEVRRVVLLLVDGMGYHLLPELTDDAPLLASVLAGERGRLDELACTFPATTPTSLVSLTTGVRPGRHGILGFTVNIPGSDRVLTHIAWRDDPPPAQWQPVPTWFQRLAAAGISTRAVLPAHFLGSGLTEAAYRGAQLHAADPGREYPQQVSDDLAATPGWCTPTPQSWTPRRTCSESGHQNGIPRRPASMRYLRGWSMRCRRMRALLVTADHGGVNAPLQARVDIGADPRLAAGVRVVAGDPRVRYLHVEPGAAVDVLAAWRSVLDGRAEVYSRDEAVAAGLFGDVQPEHLSRIGDVVVACTGDTAVLASGHEPPEVGQLIGMHGAATPAETAIPLITFRR